jgi:hypothetical protein
MTFTKVKKVEGFDGNDAIRFYSTDGRVFELTHNQDCGESVYVESITGDLKDLIDAEILRAEESTQDDPKARESGTWSFYKLATRKGYVDIRFYGSSNGYYSESVYLFEVEKR